MMTRSRIRTGLLLAALAMSALTAAGTEIPGILPDPDDKPGLANKPVKVFILSGQSNMCGMGTAESLKPLATGDEKFGYLVDENGAWTVRKDVYHLFAVMGKTDKLTRSEWLTVGSRLGPEVGIGHVLGHYYDETVLLIKVACGNRSLGFDVMPPTSRKRTGNTDTSKQYYHGWSYDNWVKGAHVLLDDLKNRFPSYQGQGYEVAGFFWWQGHKDKGMSKSDYEQLLVELIHDFRAEFKVPKAPFVVATIGFSGHNLGAWKGVFEAQMAVGDPAQHPELAGTVASVDIRDIGGGGFHYGNNGATYAKVGDAMGRAMAGLLKLSDGRKSVKKESSPWRPVRRSADTEKPAAPTKTKADRLFETAQSAEKMGQKDAAKSIYEMVIKEHPDSEAAKKAAERLKEF